MIAVNDYKKTTNFLEEKLITGSFTYFCVYKSILELCFYIKSNEGLEECWLSSTDNISIIKNSGSEKVETYIFEVLKSLIGESIKTISVDCSGTLSLEIGEYNLYISYESDKYLEEIWSITPSTPAPFKDHKWIVTLTDEQEVILNIKT